MAGPDVDQVAHKGKEESSQSEEMGHALRGGGLCLNVFMT